MVRINASKPKCCSICGYYMTTSESYAGSRCVDPGHWQAAGVLDPGDFYPMARIASRANVELSARLSNEDEPGL